MNYKKNIINKISSKKIKVCIIGLGYVGLPLFNLSVEKGYRTTGIDINIERLKQIRKKYNNIFMDYSVISKSDIIIFALPTPLNQKKNPDLSILKNSISKSFNYFKKGQLIIIESTSYPGTTKVCLKKVISKYKVGKDFFISYSPERIDPGNKKFNIKNIPKIVSGYSRNCLNIAEKFYKSICDKTIKSSSIEAAEFSKIYENIFRFVNIGLANETKRIAKKLNLNFYEILKLSSSKPFGFLGFYPGTGVGGHCIPVDPFYLSWLARKKKIKTEFVKLSGKINNATPKLIFNEITGLLLRKNLKRILILGISYKKDIEDIRNSPNIEIFNFFNQVKKFKVCFNDDLVKNFRIKKKKFFTTTINASNLKKFDAIIYLNDHKYYNKKFILDHSRIIFDCTNSFPKNKKVKFI